MFLPCKYSTINRIQLQGNFDFTNQYLKGISRFNVFFSLSDLKKQRKCLLNNFMFNKYFSFYMYFMYKQESLPHLLLANQFSIFACVAKFRVA